MMSSQHEIPLLLFTTLCLLFSTFSSSSALCQSDQSLALLEFKQSFGLVTDPHDRCAHISYGDQISRPRTNSWKSSIDCCRWDGVKCDKFSGHVVELDLSCSLLVGDFDPNNALFGLSRLRKLNLAWNYFGGSLISNRFGDLPYLTHLNLSYSHFIGEIPSEVILLPKLISLDLSGLILTFEDDSFKFLCENSTQLRELLLDGIPIHSTIPPNLSSLITTLSLPRTGLRGSLPSNIFHLPNLQKLDLSGNENLRIHHPNTRWNSSSSLTYLDIGDTRCYPGIVKSLGNVTRLEHLGLANCGLSGKVSETILNLEQLTTLDLSANHLDSGFADLFMRFGKLKRLKLGDNGITGRFPYSITNLTQLKVLDISNNSIYGRLPHWFSNLSTLHVLDLSYNLLQGSIPASLSRNKDLTLLDISSNSFNGSVSVLGNLKRLETLILSYNRLSIINTTSWSESLMVVHLSACDLTEFSFLRNSKSLNILDLSNNNLNGRLPEWAWSNWGDTLGVLDLSHNSLTGVEGIHQLQSLYMVDLRSNLVQGHLPVLSTALQYFFASNNKFSGEIPLTLCNVSGISILDLANNNLSGSVPQCLVNGYMEVLDLHDNEFRGSVPTHFAEENQLHTLNLRGNKLEGTIPRSLANCTKLQVLDLANNSLSGTFPEWLLVALPQLQVLSLRSNKFHGNVTASDNNNTHISSQLKIMDLSHNEFTGVLPMWLFESLAGMKITDEAKPRSYFGDDNAYYYKDSLVLVVKGIEYEIERILTVFTSIDLSNNKFEGNIPAAIGQLLSLRGLNLSHNMLSGHIPYSLGQLRMLESLDLSSNQLVGMIPKELASITFLSVFNVSHNHLRGCIPRENQFNTFEKNSYQGNDGLLGFPLTKDCSNDSALSQKPKLEMPPQEEEGTSSILDVCSLEAVLLGFGCGVAFGILVGSHMLFTRKPYWIARMVDEVAYKIAMKVHGKRSKAVKFFQ